MPHLAASGCVQATMPLVLCTTLLRLANFCITRDPGGKTDGVVSGMVGEAGRAGSIGLSGFSQGRARVRIEGWEELD